MQMNNTINTCANCGTSSTTLQTCSGCRRRYYCSKDCQSDHWKRGGHSTECKQMAHALRKEYFPTVYGVNAKFLCDYLVKEMKKDFVDVSIEEFSNIPVCDVIQTTIKRILKNKEEGGGIWCLAELFQREKPTLQNNNKKKNTVLVSERVSAFICYNSSYPFVSHFIPTLLSEDAERMVFVDFACSNVLKYYPSPNHAGTQQESSLTPEYFHCFRSVIKQVGNVQLMQGPGNDFPKLTTRIWCVWEILSIFGEEDHQLDMLINPSVLNDFMETFSKTIKDRDFFAELLDVTDFSLEEDAFASSPKDYNYLKNDLLRVKPENLLGTLEKILEMEYEKMFMESTRKKTPSMILLINQGRFFEVLENWTQAEMCYKYQVGLLYKRNDVESNELISDCLNNIGYCLEHQEKLEDALSFYQKSMEYDMHLLGEDHLLTLRSMSNVANVLQQLQRFGEAKRILSRCVEIQQSMDLVEVEEKIDLMYNKVLLGLLEDFLGNHEKAGEYYEENLESMIAYFGGEGADAANLFGNMAENYRKRGLLKKAMFYFEKCLGVYMVIKYDESIVWLIETIGDLTTQLEQCNNNEGNELDDLSKDALIQKLIAAGVGGKHENNQPSPDDAPPTKYKPKGRWR